MIYRQAVFNSNWPGVVTAENPIVTIPPGGTGVQLGRGITGVLVRGWLTFKPGTGATGVQFRLRIGSSASGVQAGNTITLTGLAAGTEYTVPLGFVDDFSELWDTAATTGYVVTAQQTGAPTAAGLTDAFTLTLEVV